MRVLVVLLSLCNAVLCCAQTPRDILNLVRKTTWHEGCPVNPGDLRVVEVSYLNFQKRPARGLMVVNHELAEEVKAIFAELLKNRFLIEKVQPIEEFGGSDDRSMEANNTSAYNCRDVTGVKGKFSNHSWGRAIDINPLTNPYVKGDKVLPAGGRAYLDRTKAYVGGIAADGVVVKAFVKRGWTWGGAWTDRQDYQHFEKPVR